MANVEASERKSREETETRERTEERERNTTKLEELTAKLAREKRIIETEPAGTVASDLAKDEYEYARAELQQLTAR